MTARHNAYMTDEDWAAAQRLAVHLSVKRGAPVSVSEAIRLAVEWGLDDFERDPPPPLTPKKKRGRRGGS